MAFGKPGLTDLLLSPGFDFVEQVLHVDRVLLVHSEADLPRTVGCPSALDKSLQCRSKDNTSNTQTHIEQALGHENPTVAFQTSLTTSATTTDMAANGRRPKGQRKSKGEGRPLARPAAERGPGQVDERAQRAAPACPNTSTV